MSTPKSVSNMRIASRVCKFSAWSIAAIGIVVVVVYVSTILPAIPYFRQDSGLSPYAYITYTNVIITLFVLIVLTLFFTVILYTLGTFIEYMTGEAKPIETEEQEQEDEEDDERLEIVPIPDMR